MQIGAVLWGSAFFCDEISSNNYKNVRGHENTLKAESIT
jgi:hypothetical protein